MARLSKKSFDSSVMTLRIAELTRMPLKASSFSRCGFSAIARKDFSNMKAKSSVFRYFESTRTCKHGGLLQFAQQTAPDVVHGQLGCNLSSTKR